MSNLRAASSIGCAVRDPMAHESAEEVPAAYAVVS